MPSKASTNVAAKNIIVHVNSRLGSAVNYGTSKAKVLTIGKAFFTVRYLAEGLTNTALATNTERFPISNDKVVYNGGWGTHHTIVKGFEEVMAIYKEIYGAETEDN
jgi:hypothetical protein